MQAQTFLASIVDCARKFPVLQLSIKQERIAIVYTGPYCRTGVVPKLRTCVSSAIYKHARYRTFVELLFPY